MDIGSRGLQINITNVVVSVLPLYIIYRIRACTSTSHPRYVRSVRTVTRGVTNNDCVTLFLREPVSLFLVFYLTTIPLLFVVSPYVSFGFWMNVELQDTCLRTGQNVHSPHKDLLLIKSINLIMNKSIVPSVVSTNFFLLRRRPLTLEDDKQTKGRIVSLSLPSPRSSLRGSVPVRHLQSGVVITDGTSRSSFLDQYL